MRNENAKENKRIEFEVETRNKGTQRRNLKMIVEIIQKKREEDTNDL